MGPNIPNNYTPKDPERVARQFIARKLNSGNDVYKDQAVDVLIRNQGSNPDDSESRAQASKIVMKIFMDYNCSGMNKHRRQLVIAATIKRDLSS